MHNFLVFLIIAIIVIVVALNRVYRVAKRTAALTQWGRTHGLSYRRGRDSTMHLRYSRFTCLARGSDCYAYNILRGAEQGREICAFDYHCQTKDSDGSGSNQGFSAVIVTPRIPLKPLSIREGTLFDKFRELLGFPDIELESAEFNRQFHVTSPDRRWAFDVLSQQSMEFLLASPRFSIDFDEGSVIAYNGQFFSPATFEAALCVIVGLLNRIPASVIQDLKETDG